MGFKFLRVLKRFFKKRCAVSCRQSEKHVECEFRAKFHFKYGLESEHISGLNSNVEELNDFHYTSLIKGATQESSQAGFVDFPR